jgi:hypothetical protein
MNDWADTMTARIKARQQARQRQDRERAESEGGKVSKGKPLWDEVKKQISINCAALNEKLGSKILTPELVNLYETRVRCDFEGKHKYLSAAYNANSAILAWTCDHQTGSWEVMQSEDGSAYFVGNVGGAIPTHPPKIATDMLTALLKV